MSASTQHQLTEAIGHLSRCPEGRIGYDIAGGGSLVVLVLGMYHLRGGHGLQPTENAIPLVGRNVVARYGPRLLAVLNTVSARLSASSLRALDARVELSGQDPRPVAGSWPRAQGLASMREVSR
ncbi:MAG: glycine betaine ABC transporter substrate-binding protein [Streptosporangiaceae bacterium]